MLSVANVAVCDWMYLGKVKVLFDVFVCGCASLCAVMVLWSVAGFDSVWLYVAVCDCV